MDESSLEFIYFCKVDEDGKVLDWPVSAWDVMNDPSGVAEDNKDISLISSRDWGYFKRVFKTSHPAPATFTKVMPDTPVFKNGFYMQNWVTVPFTMVEIKDALQAAKDRVNADINQARLDANNSFFVYQGKQIACDQLSRSDIDGMNGLVQITKQLPAGWIGYWKAMDNTRIPITSYNEWVAFYMSMYAQGIKHFAHAQYLKGMLDMAQTMDEITRISWKTETPYMKPTQ